MFLNLWFKTFKFQTPHDFSSSPTPSDSWNENSETGKISERFLIFIFSFQENSEFFCSNSVARVDASFVETDENGQKYSERASVFLVATENPALSATILRHFSNIFPCFTFIFSDTTLNNPTRRVRFWKIGRLPKSRSPKSAISRRNSSRSSKPGVRFLVSGLLYYFIFKL